MLEIYWHRTNSFNTKCRSKIIFRNVDVNLKAYAISKLYRRQFDGLLMMGIEMPETCWEVSVRQSNKFYDWLLHLVGCFIRVIESARNHKPLIKIKYIYFIRMYLILKTFIHNLWLKLLMFITSNELLCSIVITLSNYLYYLGVTEWLVLNCSTLVLWRTLAIVYTLC